MLPMILGFLGSAFAPAIAGATGIAALASPLLAGAIGQGVGTAIEQRDLGAGLRAGLGSFVGGKVLGGLMGSTAGAAAAGGAASGAGGTVTPLLPQLQAAQAAQAAPGGLANLFSGGAGGGVGASGFGSALQSGMDFMGSAAGVGSTIGAALATPPPSVGTQGTQPTPPGPAEFLPIPTQVAAPPEDYQPGIDPEFNYQFGRPYTYEELVAYRDQNQGALPYAEGGEIEMDEETGEFKVETERPVAGNEKTEIVDAIAAIKGQHPQPEIALGKFLAKYGEEALRDLVDSVQSGEFDDTRERFANGENGMVRGPGDGSGVDDKVPATIDGEQDVLLADGEFVLRKDATDALEKRFGGGFLSAVNSAGDRAPEVLKKKAAA